MKLKVFFNLSLVIIGLLINPGVFAQEEEFSAEIDKGEQKLYDRGGVGTIGTALSRIASFVSLNGFANTGIYWDGEDQLQFEQSEVNLLITANINDKLSTEFNLEFRDNGSIFEVEYMFSDYKFNEMFVLRFGKFLLPTGDYNEYIEIPYIHKLATEPLSTLVSPSEWTDIGLQFRGKLSNRFTNFVPYYALAVTNGLQYKLGIDDDDLGDIEASGFSDNNKNKGITAQIGTEYFKNFNTSISFQSSKYDTAASLGASVAGFSASYDNNKLALYGEFHNNWVDELVEEENTGELEIEQESSFGYYFLTAYKFGKIEPVLRYDFASVAFENDEAEGEEEEGEEEEGVKSFTAGLNYYFLRTGLIKLNYRKILFGDDSQDVISATVVLTF